MEKTEVIIIGQGPAALSAAIYLARAKASTLIIGKKQETQLNEAYDIENLLGFPNGIHGKKLLELGIKQAKSAGAKILNEKATSISVTKQGFIVKTKTNSYESNYILLAIGNLIKSKSLIQNLNLELNRKIIKTNNDNETNIKNLYAVGNCATMSKQIAKDIGDGCNAALSIIRKIKKKDLYCDYGPLK